MVGEGGLEPPNPKGPLRGRKFIRPELTLQKDPFGANSVYRTEVPELSIIYPDNLEDV